MNTNNGICGASLIWSMASLGSINNSGGGEGSGTPGKDGNNWLVVNEPLSDNFPSPLGSKKGDLVLDNSGEIFRVVEKGENLVLESTGVTLSPTIDQKSLYQLYLDLKPTSPLTENQFHDRFLEALEDSENFNLFEFYQASGGLKYTTEKEFNDTFVKLMDFDPDTILTDRIVSENKKNHVISDNEGIDALGEKIKLESKTSIDVKAVNFLLDAQGITIKDSNNPDAESVIITNVIDPVNDLDAVNKRTLDNSVKNLTDALKELEDNLTDTIAVLETKHDKDIADINKLIVDTQQTITDLEAKHDKDIADVNQTITDLETKHDLDMSNLKSDLKTLADQHVKDIITLQESITDLKDLHDKDIADLLSKIKDLTDENTTIKQTITDLETKHDEDIENLQNQITNLENSVITAINNYLTEQLPGMIEDEVKKQLADLEGGCNCDPNYPPDVIDGNTDITQTPYEILVVDNGDANDTEFDYIMMTSNRPDALNGNRLLEGGDAVNNMHNKLTFEEWMKAMNLTKVYDGGSAEQKDEIMGQYFVWLGGSATSEY